MKKLIHEIHRRSLWQVLGVYLAGSWVALQVVEQLAEAAALPEWVRPFSLVLLILGFPIVMATAIVQEGVTTREPEPEARPRAGGGEAAPSSAPAPGVLRSLFTWRRAILGGVGAFTLLGIGIGGWIAMRALGIGPPATLVARGVLDERDRLLLADFANRTSDSLLAGVVTEALRVDLAQSNLVRLAEQSAVARALELMERSPAEPLDQELARLVAQREGFAAVLVGEVGEAGSGYVLSARLLEPGNGEILVTHRETAEDDDEVIPAIDRLSRRLRERIGESLGSLRAAPPLDRVTTSDLEALRFYTQARRASETEGDFERGIQLLEQAIAHDTAFASAYRALGIILGNRQEEPDRRRRALAKAYQHRDRLSRHERFMTIGSYHAEVTGDRQQAMAAYRNLLDFDPEFYPALNNLGILYFDSREYARALDLYLRAAEADSSSTFPYFNAVIAQLALGRPAEARRSLAVVDSLFPGYPYTLFFSARLDALEGDYDAARDGFLDLLERFGTDLFWKAESEGNLAAVAAIEGRLRDYEARLRAHVAANEERGLPGEVLSAAVSDARLQLGVRRDTARALRAVAEGLERHPLESLAASDRPYLELAELYAAAGRAVDARTLVEAYEREVPWRGPEGESDLLRSRARIASVEGRFEEAIELLRRSDTGPCTICPLDAFVNAYERAGMTDSAIVARERYLEMPFIDRLYWDASLLAGTLERLGEFYDEKGDLENAAKYYAMFVELWEEADEELQPRVRAAQERLERIVAERG